MTGEVEDGVRPSDAALPPLCPRCGYDLIGQTSLWRESCPMRGQCSECGLEFRWSHVLGEAARVAWLFEARERQFGGARRRFVRTSWRALRPRKFWTSVDLATPIHRGRLVVFMSVWVLGAYLLGATGNTLAVVNGRSWGNGLLEELLWTMREEPGEFAAMMLQPFREPGVVMGREVAVWWVVCGWLPVMLSTPIVFMALGETLARAGGGKGGRGARGVRRVHILRGLAYAPPVVLAWSAPMAAVVGGAIAVRALFPAATGPIELAEFVGVLTALVAATGAQMWWWSIFATRYLKIRHAAATAVVAVLVGMLASVTLVMGIAMNWGP